MSLLDSLSQSFNKEDILFNITIGDYLDYFLGVFEFIKSGFVDFDPKKALKFKDGKDSEKRDKVKKIEPEAPNLDISIKKNKTGKNIEIKNEEDTAEFFIKAKNHNPIFYRENLDTKIGEIIEKYIKKVGEKAETKSNFYYHDKKITDTKKSLRELEISHLSFIIYN